MDPEGLQRWVSVAVLTASSENVCQCLRSGRVGLCFSSSQICNGRAFCDKLIALVLRVLYRLWMLSEHAPFDSAMCSELFPFLAQVPGELWPLAGSEDNVWVSDSYVC